MGRRERLREERRVAPATVEDLTMSRFGAVRPLKTGGDADLDGAQSVRHVQRSAGYALDTEVRPNLDTDFGHDFSTIPVFPPEGRDRTDRSHGSLAGQLKAASDSGNSLEPNVQRQLERGLDADLSGVRVHTDGEADRLSREVNAEAFTSGPDIFFRSGAYDPGSAKGMQLMAHEAAHTVQQAAGPVEGASRPDGIAMSNPDDSFEQAATRAADRITSDPSGSSGHVTLLPSGLRSVGKPKDVGGKDHDLRLVGDGGPVSDTESAGSEAGRSTTGSASMVQRRAARAENPNDYVDLLNGIGDITEATAHKGSGLGEVHFGKRLSQRHSDMLQNLRVALILMYSPQQGSAGRALTMWESLGPELSAALRRSGELGVPMADVAAIQQQLNYISEKLIRPAAYWEAHNEALSESKVKAPDLVFQQEKLEKAEKEFEAGKQMAEEATKLTGEAVTQIAVGKLGMGKDIVELVTLPGSIGEKLEWAKKNGLLAKTATGAELVSKVLGAVNTFVSVSYEVTKSFAEAQHALALTRNAVQMAEHWEGIAKRCGEKLEMLEKVGRGLAVLGAIANGLKMLRAILRGDWEEALNEAGSVAVDIMGILGGGEAAPLLGAITIVIKAEIEVLSLAAEFVRWCKEESVREAAGAFIDECDKVAKGSALDFVADAELLLDPTHADLSDIVGNQLTIHSKYVKNGLAILGNHLISKENDRLGGHPQLKVALGPAAEKALSNPLDVPDDPLDLAEQVRDVFAGANAMARYVRSNYPTGDKAKAKKE